MMKIYAHVLMLAAAIVLTQGNVPSPAALEIGYMVSGEILSRKNDPMHIRQDFIEKNTTRMKSMDPNFPEKGNQIFSGVSLGALQDLAGSRHVGSITLIAKDQYISYLPAQKFNFDNVLLAHMENDRPISGERGGPVKLIFPSAPPLHPAANAWYVEMVVMGKIPSSVLSVTSGGKNVRFTREDLEKFNAVKKKQMVPIPKGYRHDMPSLPKTPEVTTILLKDLLKNMASEEDYIRMKPMAGREYVMDMKTIMKTPVQLVIAIGGKGMEPVCGGPFSVMFPVLQYPEMMDVVPGIGGLFFVTSLVVEP